MDLPEYNLDEKDLKRVRRSIRATTDDSLSRNFASDFENRIPTIKRYGEGEQTFQAGGSPYSAALKSKLNKDLGANIRSTLVKQQMEEMNRRQNVRLNAQAQESRVTQLLNEVKERKKAAKRMKEAARARTMGQVFGAVGAVVGGIYGGPAGAMAGYSAGSAIGSGGKTTSAFSYDPEAQEKYDEKQRQTQFDGARGQVDSGNEYGRGYYESDNTFSSGGYETAQA